MAGVTAALRGLGLDLAPLSLALASGHGLPQEAAAKATHIIRSVLSAAEGQEIFVVSPAPVTVRPPTPRMHARVQRRLRAGRCQLWALRG